MSVCLSVRPSVLMQQLGSHWTVLHKIWHSTIFRKSVEEIQLSLKSDKNNRYFTWRPIYIYDHISLSSLRNEKCFRQNRGENQNTHFMFSILFPKILHLWGNVEKYCTAGQTADYNMAHTHACWIPKTTNTHSEYVIIIAFPLQQWLYERDSLLRYTYVACLVYFIIINWSVFLMERGFILCEERNECLSAS
jgi:hypothetical protein